MRSLSFVLPAFNEAATIGACVARAAAVLEDRAADWEIIVVDDGSADATARVAAAADPRVRLVRHDRNEGYGAALRSGLRAATRDLVFFTDADLQFDVEEIDLLLPWIDRYPIVAGFRHARQDPWNRRVNAWAWGRLVDALFDLDVRDVNCAFKLFRRRVIDQLEIRSTGAFVNTEILARARAAGFAVRQVPVAHFPRRAGRATGARAGVVARAFLDLARLHGELHAPGPEAESAFAQGFARTG